MKNKRIFISGGTGVIGRELVQKLFKQKYKIFVGDLKPKPAYWPDDILYRQGDLNYITKKELELFNPEIFIHLAATFERSIETKTFWNENYKHNVNLSHHLIDLLKDFKTLKKVIFASSYLIYDQILYNFNKPHSIPYILHEKDITSPRNLTGSAKLSHEIELEYLNNFYKFDTLCLRIFRGYGKGSRCVISRWIKDLLENKEITVYNKEGMFDYIYSEDIAECIARSIENSKMKGIINLGTGKARKVEDIVNIFKTYFPNVKTVKKKSNIKYEASQANINKLKNYLNWQPKIVLEKGIGKIIEYEKNKLKEDNKQYNILATSISQKISFLENIKNASKKISSNIKLFGGDVDKDCKGKYFVDEFWKMPYLCEIGIENFITYCKNNNIKHIIPSRDDELLYFSVNKNLLNSHNIYPMVSDTESILLCNNKYRFYEHLKKNKLPFIPTFRNIKKILEFKNKNSFKKIVCKKKYGASSLDIKILDKFKDDFNFTDYIYQPFIEGQEISVDLYIGREKNIKGMVQRERNEIIDGESHITTTINNKKIEKLCQKINECFDFYGHILIQFIIDKNNKIWILEINPRFGGASNLSIKCGLDSFYWFLLESNETDISNYPFIYNKEKKYKQITYKKHKIIEL